MAFKRVLSAVDFSPDSLRAFRAAAEIARLHSAALLIFHVVEAEPPAPDPLPARGAGEAVLEVVEKANAAVEALIEDALPALSKVPFTTEVTTGRAYEEIVKRAREWRADLVVLGAKGTALLEEIVVGGTARAVLENAPCSVLVVRGK